MISLRAVVLTLAFLANFCGLMVLASPPPPVPVPSAPTTHELQKARDFYLIVLNSFLFINSRLTQRHSLDDSQTISRLLSDLDAESSAVSALGLKQKPFASDYDRKPFEQFVIPELYRFKLRSDLSPTTETLRKFFTGNPQHYPRKESVRGYRILVSANSPQLSSTLEKLSKRLEKEPFELVAKDFYESLGQESIGYLGRVERGQIPEDEFERYLAAPLNQPFFGPEKTSLGYLFGKVTDKVTSQTDMFDYYHDQLLFDYQREKSKRLLNDFLSELMQTFQPKLFPFDPESSSPEKQTAYEIHGKKVAFEEVLQRLPQYTGDRKDPRFWDAMAGKALQDDLLLESTVSQAMRSTPEFAWLAQIHENAWLVFRHIRSQQAAPSVNEQILRQFYEAHKTDLYAQSDLVRLLKVSLPRSDMGQQEKQDDSPVETRQFAQMKQLREKFVQAPGEKTAHELQAQAPALKVEVDKAPGPANELGRVFEMAIKDQSVGYVSPVLVSREAYHFVQLLSREPRPAMAYDAERVRYDYMKNKEEAVRASIYPAK